jgi:DNA repair exonuclease SbcCD nuclease subunit
VISGDLYEHHYVTDSTIHWLDVQFKCLGDKPVILVPGNHDPCVSNSWYRTFPWSPNVHILTTGSPEYLDQENGVYFYGIGFDTFRQERLPEVPPPSISPNRINICLFHGTLDMAFSQSPYNPVALNTLLGLGMDYYALGHFHGKNEVHARSGVVNAGSPEPLGFDEPGDHGIYQVSLEKKDGRISREIQFIPMQKRYYRELEMDITGCSSGVQLRELLENKFDWAALRNDIIRMKITGRLTPGVPIDLPAAEEFLGRNSFHAELVDLTKPAYDLDILAADSNITGVFIRRMQEKMAEAVGEDRKILEKALELGLDALLRGSVEFRDRE